MFGYKYSLNQKVTRCYMAYNTKLKCLTVKKTRLFLLYLNDQVKIYPNPASEAYFVELPGQKFEIRIYDIKGNLIAEYKDIQEKLRIELNFFIS